MLGVLTRPPEHWVRTMEREEAMTAALQLQHDAGLIMSNLQVLGQFVTPLNRMSSEIFRGDAACVRPGGVSLSCSAGHFTISSDLPCGSLHGSDGIMAPAASALLCSHFNTIRSGPTHKLLYFCRATSWTPDVVSLCIVNMLPVLYTGRLFTSPILGLSGLPHWPGTCVVVVSILN